MRKFSSYGPVNEKHHYCVSRKELVDECVKSVFVRVCSCLSIPK